MCWLKGFLLGECWFSLGLRDFWFNQSFLWGNWHFRLRLRNFWLRGLHLSLRLSGGGFRHRRLIRLGLNEFWLRRLALSGTRLCRRNTFWHFCSSFGGSSQSTTELVAGKQVNSRLYVRYAYGVFTEIGNLLLRYRLSDRLTIEAGTGESQSMDLLYLVEKP